MYLSYIRWWCDHGIDDSDNNEIDDGTDSKLYDEKADNKYDMNTALCSDKYNWHYNNKVKFKYRKCKNGNYIDKSIKMRLNKHNDKYKNIRSKKHANEFSRRKDLKEIREIMEIYHPCFKFSWIASMTPWIV